MQKSALRLGTPVPPRVLPVGVLVLFQSGRPDDVPGERRFFDLGLTVPFFSFSRRI